MGKDRDTQCHAPPPATLPPWHVPPLHPRRFPVPDLHFNNVPALSRSRFIPDPHRFESPATDDPEEQLLVFLRK